MNVQLLNQQVGVVNFEPLKPFFMSLFMGAHCTFGGVATAPPLSSPLQRVDSAQGPLPILCTNLQHLVERLKLAYNATTRGQFPEALTHFVYIMHALLFVVVQTKQDKTEIQELLHICKEYVTGIRMELFKKNLPPTSSLQQVELAAYFTHCNLQPIHRMLSLRSAMKAAYRIKNFQMAASFATRLLELNPKPEVASEARKVIKFAESNSSNQHTLNYDERNPFVVCGISFTPIYKNRPSAECPYCGTAFLPEHAGKLCPSCQLAEIGKQVSGMKSMSGRE
jgi:coatomer protein complex subunit alpha (xenin)